MTAEKVGRHRRTALVRDAIEHDAGLQLQQLVGNMAHRCARSENARSKIVASPPPGLRTIF